MHVRWTLRVFGLLACFSVVTRAVEPAYQTPTEWARELVAAMYVEEQAEQKVEMQVLSRCRADKCDADLRECLLKKPDRERLASQLAALAARELSIAEMQQAIDYFHSETGLKHLDVLRAEQGLGGSDTLFNQSPEVRARMLAFLDTRVGYLLITRALLNDGVGSWVGNEVFNSFLRCTSRP